jgi:hypothetical protein
MVRSPKGKLSSLIARKKSKDNQMDRNFKRALMLVLKHEGGDFGFQNAPFALGREQLLTGWSDVGEGFFEGS